MFARFGSDLGSLFYHSDNVVVFEFTCTKPTCEAKGLTFNVTEGVDSVFEFTPSFFNLVTEFQLICFEGTYIIMMRRGYKERTK